MPKAAKPSSKQPEDIKSLLNQLDEIVAWFEQDEIDIAQALDKYEAGLAKIKAIEKQLERAKVEIEKIDKKFDK